MHAIETRKPPYMGAFGMIKGLSRNPKQSPAMPATNLDAVPAVQDPRRCRLPFGHASFPVLVALVSGVVMFIFLAQAAISIRTGPAIDDMDIGVWMQVADFPGQ